MQIWRPGIWLAATAVLFLVPGAAMANGPGARAFKEFLEEGLIYPDDDWQEYVQAIGARLVEVSDRPNGDFHFYILDDDSVNAMAFPDGYIYVHRGLLRFMQSEDQLAAVLGHEIAHITADHHRKRNLLGAFGAITGFVGAILTGRGELMNVSNAATGALSAGYGREHELEADELGAEYLVRAGYNPLAVIEMLQVLKDHELFANQFGGGRQTYHGLFATHPRNDKRLHEAVQKAAGDMPEELVEPVGDFWSLMDGLVFGNQSAAGVVRDSSYIHGRLRFVLDFPEGWDVGSTATQVSGRAPGGSTQGLITLQRQEADLSRQDPESYITEVLNRTDLAGGEKVTVNGFDAFIGQLDIQDDEAAAAKLIATLFKDEAVYLFRGEAGEGVDAEQFAADFRSTVESFRQMTAADARMANNQRIAVVEARPGDTYASLARQSSLQRNGEQILRLMNGHHPNGEPRAGDYVKVVK